MIHGCDKKSNSENFEHMFPALIHSKFRVIAIDMPGYGKSSGAV
jgi:pimeloyl-ACP methyl ester carboxylesterase